MDTRRLIDGIVQQTTVLIAHISTAAGIRAPLAHVADQVFLDLAKEIEAQGVVRKVVADMFGMALRTYQKKMQRLGESVTLEGQTLWQAVLDFVVREGSVSRTRVFERFVRDSGLDVAAVLNDLIGSGLVYSTGRGDAAVYGPTSQSDRHALSAQQDQDSLVHEVWLVIYDARVIAEAALRKRFLDDGARFELALQALIAEGRVGRETRDGDSVLSSTEIMIPVGSEQGWESAVLDHFRAVASAIATKVRRFPARSGADDLVGGATLSFDLHPGHPHEAAVYGLLRRVRDDVNVLWNEVTEYNRAHPRAESEQTRLHFYFGQTIESAGIEERPAITEASR
jgi:hypothetical protein